MKKLFSVVFILALLLNFTSINADASNKSTFGSSEIDEALIELLKTDPALLLERYDNIIDVQTIALSNKGRSSEGVEAYEYDEYGSIQRLETEASVTKVVYYDAADISASGDENTSSLYLMTASAESKTSEDAMSKDGCVLAGYIVWIDHFGLENELVSFSGTRSGSYLGKANYTGQLRTSSSCYDEFDTSFIDISLQGKTASTITLIINSYTGKGNKMQLLFRTSIFD